MPTKIAAHSIDDHRLTRAEMARIANVSVKTIYKRLQKGMTPEQAMNRHLRKPNVITRKELAARLDMNYDDLNQKITRAGYMLILHPRSLSSKTQMMKKKKTILEMVNEGFTGPEIASAVGISETRVKRWAQKWGTPLSLRPVKPATLRKFIKSKKLSQSDALEYVLQAYENVTGQFDGCHTLSFQNLKLTQAELTVFGFLKENVGERVKKTTLLDHYYSTIDEGDLPDVQIIDVLISKIRKKIKGSQFTIETIWGVGYRLIEKTINLP